MELVCRSSEEARFPCSGEALRPTLRRVPFAVPRWGGVPSAPKSRWFPVPWGGVPSAPKSRWFPVPWNWLAGAPKSSGCPVPWEGSLRAEAHCLPFPGRVACAPKRAACLSLWSEVAVLRRARFPCPVRCGRRCPERRRVPIPGGLGPCPDRGRRIPGRWNRVTAPPKRCGFPVPVRRRARPSEECRLLCPGGVGCLWPRRAAGSLSREVGCLRPRRAAGSLSR